MMIFFVIYHQQILHFMIKMIIKIRINYKMIIIVNDINQIQDIII